MLYQVCRWWLRYCSVLHHRLKLKLHLFDLLWICCTTYSQQSRTNRKKCSLTLTQYCSSLTMANKNTLTRLATFEHFTIHAALDFVHICKVHMESAIGILLRPRWESVYCDQFVCVSVCPRGYLWNRWTDLHANFYADPRGRDSVLLGRRCHTLCSSGFVDGVTLGCNWPCDDA